MPTDGNCPVNAIKILDLGIDGRIWNPTMKNDTVQKVRARLLSGSYVNLDSLSKEELTVAYELITKGEVEIVSLACRPHLTRKLDRIIV